MDATSSLGYIHTDEAGACLFFYKIVACLFFYEIKKLWKKMKRVHLIKQFYLVRLSELAVFLSLR